MKTILCLLLVAATATAKDIRSDIWKRTNSNQHLDPEPAGKPHDEDVVMTSEQIQAQLVFDYLPFNIPFKLDKHQKVAVTRIVKAVAKPILKSKELRDVVNQLDNVVHAFRNDKETRIYMNAMLDIAQDLYLSKDSSALRGLVHEVFGEFVKGNKQVEGRTIQNDISNMWAAAFPYVERLIVDPLYDYLLVPFRSFAEPISKRIGNFLGVESNAIDGPEYYRSWSSRADDAIGVASEYSTQIKNGLDAVSRMLTIQDEGKLESSCRGSGCGEVSVNTA